VARELGVHMGEGVFKAARATLSEIR
jgi:hypothetical protein